MASNDQKKWCVGRLMLWLFLTLTIFSAGVVWAAPDYVTAWPKQVPVEKPDPIMGDKPFWEFWAYSETFAKRFKGFPIGKADKELSGGMQAMALRIYKENLWYGVNPNYPEQYACSLDVYFDNSIVLPLSKNPRRVFREYPHNISASYVRLDPVDEHDIQAIRVTKLVQFNMKTQPIIFVDRPLDGRYASFGVREYHQNIAPGLAVLVLASSIECSVTAPKLETGMHWLSLFGHRPYDKDDRNSSLWRGLQGSWGARVNTTVFDPGTTPKSEGYFRVPEAFYKAVLPKVTLVKVLNRCIDKKYLHTLQDDKTPAKKWDEVVRTCKDVEEQGVIYDFYFDEIRRGLRELGF